MTFYKEKYYFYQYNKISLRYFVSYTNHQTNRILKYIKQVET